MLNKFAQVKEAEVRGVLAAFVDNGLINVQTPQQFDKLASVVSNNLPASYTVDDIANLTLPAMQKVAEDSSDNATQMALGELALMKVAGQVSDAEFNAMAEGILKEAKSIASYIPGYKDITQGAEDLAKLRKDGIGANNILTPETRAAGEKGAKRLIAKGSAKAALTALGAAGALTGAAHAGKKLYDKYKGE